MSTLDSNTTVTTAYHAVNHHDKKPSAPTPDVDILALLEENERLRQALAEEQAENKRLRAKLRFVDELGALSNQTASGNQRWAMLALYNKFADRGDEWVETPAWELADDSGLSKAAVYDALNHCAKKLDVIDKRTVNDWSSGELRTPTLVRLKPVFKHPRLYPKNITRNHGGDRPKCKHCGSENIDRYKVTYCRDCKQWSHEIISETPFNFDAITPPVERSGQIDHSGNDASSGQFDQPSPFSIGGQVDHSNEVPNPITPPPASLDSTTFLTAWLEKRIGRPDLIHQTGEMEQGAKYLPLVGPYWIPAYLEGRASEIYGSRPRRADGST